MKKILLSAAALSLAACANVPNNGKEEVMYINGVLADCVGVGPMKCMLVKKSPQQKEWEYFYNGIEGFDYKEGFTYTIKVNKTKVAHPPADGSSVKFKLVKIIDKKPMVYMK